MIFFFFQAEDGIRDVAVTGVQTCALPILYVERYFLEPRHIEVKIRADERGRTIYLGERDCSVQRRYQKLIEETPSPAVDDRLRRELGRVAVEAAQAVRYRNAGTVEFLLDKEHRFYFMEMNTRIQVEHPITEEVDRKSTRLNSSHGYISYAVFCLKKKKTSLLPDRWLSRCWS